MRNQDTGRNIQCPYCASSDDCTHRLALIDQTFNECSGGYAYERYHEFQLVIDAAFLRLFRQGDFKQRPWRSETLRLLWEYACEAHSLNGEDVSVDQYVVTRLITELFEAAGAIKYTGCVKCSGAPGYCSAWTLFHAKSPPTVFEAALANLKVLLKSRD